MKKAEREHLAKVTALGCVVCRNLGYGASEAEIHHIRHGYGLSQRASNYETLPLCHRHHRTGGPGVAFHATGRARWEGKFGAEVELLAQVYDELCLSPPECCENINML